MTSVTLKFINFISTCVDRTIKTGLYITAELDTVMDKLNIKGGPDKIKGVLHSAGVDFEQNPATDLQAWVTPPTNYIGTISFLSYIASALWLTTTIVLRDILPRWRSAKTTSGSKRMDLSALALVSFSVLSVNMMTFLYDSFQTYLTKSGHGASIDQLWPWMLNSNLFTSFARGLLAGKDEATWTIQALIMTMIIGAEMSSLGRQHKVQNLWMYFCLGQILPPAFSYYLLRLQIHLRELSQPQTRSRSQKKGNDFPDISDAIASFAVLGITVGSIYMLSPADATTSDWRLLLNVLWLRLLLFVPLFVNVGSVLPTDSNAPLQQNTYVLVTGIFMFMTLGQGPWKKEDPVGFLKAGFSNPAIRTLSCDWIIKVIGNIAEIIVA